MQEWHELEWVVRRIQVNWTRLNRAMVHLNKWRCSVGKKWLPIELLILHFVQPNVDIVHMNVGKLWHTENNMVEEESVRGKIWIFVCWCLVSLLEGKNVKARKSLDGIINKHILSYTAPTFSSRTVWNALFCKMNYLQLPIRQELSVGPKIITSQTRAFIMMNTFAVLHKLNSLRTNMPTLLAVTWAWIISPHKRNCTLRSKYITFVQFVGNNVGKGWKSYL